MTEVLHAPVRDSRHRSISPHRRLELGKDYSPYRSSPGITPAGKPPLVRASTNSSIILRHHHHNRQREESPLLTNRREAKKLHKDLHVDILQSEVSPLSIPQTDSSHTTVNRNNNTVHGLGGGRLKVQNEMATSSPCLLPKLPSPTSTPPVARRRAWTMGSNKHLKSALNYSPNSSPAVVRKKRNSSSPKFHFASLPSSRQSSPKSSASQGVRNSKTVTVVVVKGNKQITQQQPTVDGNISKNEKNVHNVVSSTEADDVVNEQEQKSDIKAVVIMNNNPEIKADETQKPEKVGESQQNTNKSSDNNNGSSGKNKSLPEGLSEDVYERCVHWLAGVRAADDDKCLDVVTQPDLQWKD